MNTKSIRFKIVILFSSILIIAIGVVFASFYIFTNKIIYQEVDKELSLHTHNLDQFGNIPTMVTVELDQNGNAVKSSVDFNSSSMLFNNLFKIAQKSKSITFINQNVGNTPMRFLVKPTWENNILTSVLLVAHPIEAIQKSLTSLMSTLAIIFIAIILPIIFGAILFTHKIIKPISVVIKNMDDITTENLDMRLPNPRSNDEIERLTLTFNNLLDRLQQSFKRERQFIGDVAHELKTPIATLKSGVELTLSKERPKEEYKKTLVETIVDIDRISALLQNILDLAWIGADKNKVNNKNFNLSDTVEELREIAVKLGTKKQISVKANIQSNIMIYGDEGKIARAILNVIDNAMKYTPNKKLVYISLRKSMNEAIVEIKDAGVGIPKNDLEHVFERFYRGSKTAKTLGSGLGLAISQGIINTYKGTIRIDSVLGKGTTVKITLPL